MIEVRNILDVGALQALEANSRTTTDISIRAESGNHLMLDLTQKARKDARTLKTVTILTLIYLPASFVAVGILLFPWLDYGGARCTADSLGISGFPKHRIHQSTRTSQGNIDRFCQRNVDICNPDFGFSLADDWYMEMA